MRKVPGVGDARPTCCCLHRRSWKHARAPPALCPPKPVVARRQWGRTSQRRRGPWAGVRVGEAEQPGPSTVADELLQQRARAADALARARTSLPPFPPLPPPALAAPTSAPIAGSRRPSSHQELDEADTQSDTLSATTPVAMPPPRPRNLAAAEQRRDRVYHALGQMRLVSASARHGPANGGSRPDTSACEHYLTPFASPAGSPRQRLRPGEAAPTQAEEATPGFTPPPSPPSPPSPPAPHAPPRWQDARPPSAQPGDRNSWLFVPLLHAAAGNLSEQALAAWRSLPDDAAGRFDALADALQAAPPAEPSCLARLLHSVAECDAEEVVEAPPGIPATDAALATSLRALPAAPIPLATALLLAQAPDGYVFAAAQSAFLEAYGGVPLATAARALADDLRAAITVHDTNLALAAADAEPGARVRTAVRAAFGNDQRVRPTVIARRRTCRNARLQQRRDCEAGSSSMPLVWLTSCVTRCQQCRTCPRSCVQLCGAP